MTCQVTYKSELELQEYKYGVTTPKTRNFAYFQVLDLFCIFKHFEDL